jgi:Cu2+-exporting ATPase
MVHVRNLLMNSLSTMPSTATLKSGESVEIDKIELGSILVCLAGDEIAIDGVVVRGEGLVDESSITGEPVPISKSVNDKVTSGTLV